ncbi:MAG: acyl carrier protein [Anaerolineales bacterium]
MTTQPDLHVNGNLKDVLRRYIRDDLLMGQNLVVNDDDDLLLSGLVDSLGVVRLVTFIETEFNTVVPPEDVVLENFQTLNAMAEYLHRRQTT